MAKNHQKSIEHPWKTLEKNTIKPNKNTKNHHQKFAKPGKKPEKTQEKH